MEQRTKQHSDQRSAPQLEDLWVPVYETRNLSEIVREWLPELLPWRKKKRKRP